MNPPVFSSSDEFVLDEGQAIAAILTMTNLCVFQNDLDNAAVWVNRGSKAPDLIAMLELEGITEYSHSPIPDPSGIAFTISLLEMVASTYIQAIAELKECDASSAFSYILEDYKGPPLSLSDKVTITIGVFALALAILSPIPGDETLAAGVLAGTGIAVSGIDVAFTLGNYFLDDEDSSTFMLFINILTSAIPMVPGLGSMGAAANTITSDITNTRLLGTIIDKFGELNKINGLKALPAMKLMEHPDMLLDISAALGITVEQTRNLVALASLKAQETQKLMENLRINVDNGGRGAVPPPPIIVPESGQVSGEHRLQQYLEHHGASTTDAIAAIKTWKGPDGWLHQYEFFLKYPNISLPPDLTQLRSEMLLKEGAYAEHR